MTMRTPGTRVFIIGPTLVAKIWDGELLASSLPCPKKTANSYHKSLNISATMDTVILNTPSASHHSGNFSYVAMDSPPKAPVRSRSSMDLSVLDLETKDVPVFNTSVSHRGATSNSSFNSSTYSSDKSDKESINSAVCEESRPLSALLKFPSFVFDEGDRNDSSNGAIISSRTTQILPQKRYRDRATSLDSHNNTYHDGLFVAHGMKRSHEDLQFPVLKEQMRCESSSRSLRPRRRVLSESSIDVGLCMAGNFGNLSLEVSASIFHRSPHPFRSLSNRHPLHNLEEEKTQGEASSEFETPYSSPAPLFSYKAI